MSLPNGLKRTHETDIVALLEAEARGEGRRDGAQGQEEPPVLFRDPKRMRFGTSPPPELNPFNAPTVNALENMFAKVSALIRSSTLISNKEPDNNNYNKSIDHGGNKKKANGLTSSAYPIPSSPSPSSSSSLSHSAATPASTLVAILPPVPLISTASTHTPKPSEQNGHYNHHHHHQRQKEEPHVNYRHLIPPTLNESTKHLATVVRQLPKANLVPLSIKAAIESSESDTTDTATRSKETQQAGSTASPGTKSAHPVDIANHHQQQSNGLRKDQPRPPSQQRPPVAHYDEIEILSSDDEDEAEDAAGFVDAEYYDDEDDEEDDDEVDEEEVEDEDEEVVETVQCINGNRRQQQHLLGSRHHQPQRSRMYQPEASSNSKFAELNNVSLSHRPRLNSHDSEEVDEDERDLENEDYESVDDEEEPDEEEDEEEEQEEDEDEEVDDEEEETYVQNSKLDNYHRQGCLQSLPVANGKPAAPVVVELLDSSDEDGDSQEDQDQEDEEPFHRLGETHTRPRQVDHYHNDDEEEDADEFSTIERNNARRSTTSDSEAEVEYNDQRDSEEILDDDDDDDDDGEDEEEEDEPNQDDPADWNGFSGPSPQGDSSPIRPKLSEGEEHQHDQLESSLLGGHYQDGEVSVKFGDDDDDDDDDEEEEEDEGEHRVGGMEVMAPVTGHVSDSHGDHDDKGRLDDEDGDVGEELSRLEYHSKMEVSLDLDEEDLLERPIDGSISQQPLLPSSVLDSLMSQVPLEPMTMTPVNFSQIEAESSKVGAPVGRFDDIQGEVETLLSAHVQEDEMVVVKDTKDEDSTTKLTLDQSLLQTPSSTMLHLQTTPTAEAKSALSQSPASSPSRRSLLSPSLAKSLNVLPSLPTFEWGMVPSLSGAAQLTQGNVVVDLDSPVASTEMTTTVEMSKSDALSTSTISSTSASSTSSSLIDSQPTLSVGTLVRKIEAAEEIGSAGTNIAGGRGKIGGVSGRMTTRRSASLLGTTESAVSETTTTLAPTATATIPTTTATAGRSPMTLRTRSSVAAGAAASTSTTTTSTTKTTGLAELAATSATMTATTSLVSQLQRPPSPQVTAMPISGSSSSLPISVTTGDSALTNLTLSSGSRQRHPLELLVSEARAFCRTSSVPIPFSALTGFGVGGPGVGTGFGGSGGDFNTPPSPPTAATSASFSIASLTSSNIGGGGAGTQPVGNSPGGYSSGFFGFGTSPTSKNNLGSPGLLSVSPARSVGFGFGTSFVNMRSGALNNHPHFAGQQQQQGTSAFATTLAKLNESAAEMDAEKKKQQATTLTAIVAGDTNRPDDAMSATKSPTSSVFSTATTTSTSGNTHSTGMGTVDLAAENVLWSVTVGARSLRPYINPPQKLSPSISSNRSNSLSSNPIPIATSSSSSMGMNPRNRSNSPSKKLGTTITEKAGSRQASPLSMASSPTPSNSSSLASPIKPHFGDVVLQTIQAQRGIGGGGGGGRQNSVSPRKKKLAVDEGGVTAVVEARGIETSVVDNASGSNEKKEDDSEEHSLDPSAVNTASTTADTNTAVAPPQGRSRRSRNK